jgi:hypothetical protein
LKSVDPERPYGMRLADYIEEHKPGEAPPLGGLVAFEPLDVVVEAHLFCLAGAQ